MFDLDIINHAEFLAQMYEPFERVQIFLQREGYDLTETEDELEGRELITKLGNGWVVCELI